MLHAIHGHTHGLQGSKDGEPHGTELEYEYELHDDGSVTRQQDNNNALDRRVGLRFRARVTPVAPLDTNAPNEGCLAMLHLVAGSGEVVQEAPWDDKGDGERFMGIGGSGHSLDEMLIPHQDM